MPGETQKEESKPRVLIVGGGFAGLNCAIGLASVPVEITLADRYNYHLFQPLLYQVAMAALSPAEIATPIRRLLRDQANVRVVLAKMTGVDLKKKVAHFALGDIAYDYLVLATGATHSYFGHEEWATSAPGLKTIEDALEIRRRVLLAYEAAEWEEDVDARQAKLTFVVIGGGPTGVELAGALKEIASESIPLDFRNIDTSTARVILIEAGPRLLSAMPEKLGERARQDLKEMGVLVRLNSKVTAIRDGVVSLDDENLTAENIIWAAGVRGSDVATALGCSLDPQGRVLVQSDLSIPGHPEVFVVGDLAHLTDVKTGDPVPGVAPAAIQMGKYVATLIRQNVTGDESSRAPFKYRDKGRMATIGRNRAVADVGGQQFGGFFAWLCWGIVHIIPLIGFRNKISVIFSWLWNYFSLGKKVRLITGQPTMKVKQERERLTEKGKEKE